MKYLGYIKYLGCIKFLRYINYLRCLRYLKYHISKDMQDSGNMRSNYKTEEKENFIDSDPHTPTMASCIFDNILQEIQVSNLNYQIQLSPFSALISLKKSFIKEKDGSLRLPMPPLSSSHRGSRLETDLNARNMKLEKDLETLHQKYADVSDQYAEAHARIKSYEEFHENHFKREFSKKDDIIADLKLEKNSLMEKIKERDDIINSRIRLI